MQRYRIRRQVHLWVQAGQEPLRKATEVIFELLAQAQDLGISAKYLLFDSWFAYPSTITQAARRSPHVVCMLKNMAGARQDRVRPRSRSFL
ncbi:hypothetical protein CVV65_05785 [Kyrpidia spormannii]|uniref:Transposase IS701-like DDE domain-containing protein n=1 Tax=Kyrpidia spormannii TaxID=2055160 RepID=A0A2K8N611_9BACL|nr:hypothetical protein CVV65_05785 [Kyrpidia spormannii]